MRNLALLRFLGAVQDHAATGRTLMTCAGYDPQELQIAVQTATQAGFVAATGKIHPSLRLTAEGWAWARTELAPFARLVAGETARGLV
jgi:hypothetical protein